MPDLIGQVSGFAMLAWSVEDVLELAEQEGIPCSPERAQMLLCADEDAIYEAAYYAAIARIKAVLLAHEEIKIRTRKRGLNA